MRSTFVWLDTLAFDHAWLKISIPPSAVLIIVIQFVFTVCMIVTVAIRHSVLFFLAVLPTDHCVLCP